MRRDTPGALEFGRHLASVRKSKKLTMRAVGTSLGAVAATVSKAESGQRAVKEDTLSKWSKALGVTQKSLREVWNECDSYECAPITRRRQHAVSKDKLEELISTLSASQRQRVFGYVEGILEE